MLDASHSIRDIAGLLVICDELVAIVDGFKCSSLRHLFPRRALVMAIVSSSSNKSSSRKSLSNVLCRLDSNDTHSMPPSLPSCTFDERSRSFNCNPLVLQLIAVTMHLMDSVLRFAPESLIELSSVDLSLMIPQNELMASLVKLQFVIDK